MTNFVDPRIIQFLYSQFFWIRKFLRVLKLLHSFLASFLVPKFLNLRIFSLRTCARLFGVQALTNSFLYLDWGGSKKTTGRARPQALKATGAESPEAQTKAIGRRELEDLLGSSLSRVYCAFIHVTNRN